MKDGAFFHTLALTAALTALTAACGSNEAAPGSATHTPKNYPAAQLPSSCEIPAEPAVPGPANVVGTGVADSCTNTSLQTALDAGGSITLNCGNAPLTIAISTMLKVSKDTLIDGGGTVTLDGQNQTRILSAESSVHLALRRLTLTRGVATGDAGVASGGAVRGGWRGSLDIRECVFTNNQAGSTGEQGGGAVYTPSGTTLIIVGSRFEGNRAGIGGAVHNLLSGLTVTNSVFVSNQSLTDGGGALYTDGASEKIDDTIGGKIELCGCRFQGNIGLNQGGAAYLFAYSPDRVIVNQCAFEDNQVLAGTGSGALGGGLRVGNAQLDLGGSLFARNHSDGHGGGLWVDGSYPSYVTNCTFFENDAGKPGVADGGYGGAISGANLVMTNLSIANNRAINNAGGIFNEDTSSQLSNSILANNEAGNEWGIKQACRNPMVGANNLQWPDPITDVQCTAGPLIADPLLSGLTDNGGPTETLAIDAASPAAGKGSNCPALDQRGQPRQTSCDLGAFEAP